MSVIASLKRNIVSEWSERTRQDAGYAWRGLRRSPGFTFATVLVLALGLGANAAIFSVLDRVFLSAPTGVDAPREIRRLYWIQPQWRLPGFPADRVGAPVDYPEYAAIRASAPPGVQFAAYDARPDSVDARVDKVAVAAMASFVEQSYFTTLRVRPASGRFFTADEDRVDATSAVVVISDALWHRAFGGDLAILGKQLRVANRAYSIVGVAPPGFSGIDLDRADLWFPLGDLPTPPLRRQPWYAGGFNTLRVITRVPSNIAEQRVAMIASAAFRRVHQSDGVDDTTSTILTGSIIAALGPTDRAQEISVSLRLAGVSLILLLIAVGNVANLLLVRSMRRRREIAIRRALGVSTARLCRLLVTEGLLLSTLGAAAAVLVGTWGSTALRALLLPQIHWASDSHFSHLLAFTVLVSVAVGILAALAPAFHATGLDVASAIKPGATSTRQRGVWARHALAVGQVALSVVLLVGAGLFVRSLHNVRAIDLGFDPNGLITVHAGYRDLARSREIASALGDITAELSRVPGVQHVAMGNSPMQGYGSSNRIFLPGRDSMPTLNGMGPVDFLVSPGYFTTLGLRAVAGRTFEATDRAGTAPVAVVSKLMAGVVWPGENPIGKCIQTFSRTAPCTTVVGVVDDVHTDGLIETKPFMHLYLLFSQNLPLDSLSFGVRGIGRALLIRTRPGTEAAVMRSALRIARANLPGADSLMSVNDLTQVLEPKLRPWRLGATLFSALGILAAVVAAIGMYSVIAYAASQRAHEMSVRMALGARARDIVTLVAGEGLRVILTSIAIGIVMAVAMGRLVASLLYGVSTHDPVVLLGAGALLALIGLAAILSPAIRAARNDPASALRAE